MRQIEKNSPEALARVVTLAILIDGRMASGEIEALDQHDIPALVGMSRDAFIQALVDHCRELVDQGQYEPVRMMDAGRINEMLALVEEREQRLLACRAIVVLSKSDGRFFRPEQALLRHMLDSWDISLPQVSAN